jgi:hypothetical protein
MGEILILFLLVAATRGLWKQTKEDLARWRGRPAKPPGSRQSWRSRASTGATGYWAGQAAHGFPTARHGFTDGWMRALEAHHEARRGIAQARAERAEGKAEMHPELADLRTRRRAAAERLRAQRETDRAHLEAERENRVRDEHPEWFTPAGQAGEEDGPGEDSPFSWGRADRTYLTEAGSEEEACRLARGASGRNHGQYAAWRRAFLGDVLLGTWEGGEPAGAEAGPGDEPARPADPGGAEAQDQPAGPAGPAAAATEGEQTMTETSYAGVKARMTAAVSAAEQHAADAKAAQAGTEEHMEEAGAAKRWAETTADGMQALKVDAGSLAAMDDHLEALAAVEEKATELNEMMGQLKTAWDKVQESAQQVKTALDGGGHGGVQEARDNAAGGGAEKAFYEEGAGV